MLAAAESRMKAKRGGKPPSDFARAETLETKATRGPPGTALAEELKPTRPATEWEKEHAEGLGSAVYHTRG